MAIWNVLEDLRRRENGRRGYVEVRTPQIYDKSLWETSGHWAKYREHMFTFESEGREFGLKPMNCPGHCALYQAGQWSYRDLPIRMAEPGNLHRNELSGALHGLLRVRMFSQDDGHIFCTPEQIEDEVLGCLDFGFAVYELLGLEIKVELSTRPENRVGSDEDWDKAEAALAAALDRQGIAYTVNEGDGAFYGPKIDLHMLDVLGRGWQIGTVQLDFQLPQRFGLTYQGADNVEHTPVMIHRALLGSFERFIGILIEHFGGAFPTWLAPVQVRVLPVAGDHSGASHALVAALRAEGVRADIDERDDTLGKRIRESEIEKVPYPVVWGDRESTDALAVRKRGGKGQSTLSLRELVTEIRAEIPA
jgi:threonyl-tRNA synthetase